MLRSLFISAILFCLFLPATAQTIKTYAAEWKAVDVLIKERKLPRTALEKVKKIYAMAKRDRQDAQVIKALVYMTRLQQENRLDNLTTSIQELEKEIPLNREPAVSILKSYVATLYWQYFQNYRWQLYNRTNTKGFNKDDIALPATLFPVNGLVRYRFSIDHKTGTYLFTSIELACPTYSFTSLAVVLRWVLSSSIKTV